MTAFVIFTLYQTLPVGQIKENETGWGLTLTAEIRNAYTILIAKPEGKRQIGKFTCR
jgi:hypothetical protein